MNFIFADANHDINAIQRSGSIGDYHLNWNSVGLKNFMIVVGENVNDVLVDPNDVGNSKLYGLLVDAKSELKTKDLLVFANDGICVYTITFAQLRQRGGFNVNGKPGVYAIYGYTLEDDVFTFYVSTNNTFKLSVDVNIDDKPILKEKGLLKKVQYYAGYHKVTVQNGVKGLKGNSIYYTINNGVYRYPFPDDVLNNGGSFYVKCPETGSITFDTTNKDGIRIRR